MFFMPGPRKIMLRMSPSFGCVSDPALSRYWADSIQAITTVYWLLMTFPFLILVGQMRCFMFLLPRLHVVSCLVVRQVKRRRRTPLQADGASEAPPHEDGNS
jgi:hypothetical protein